MAGLQHRAEARLCIDLDVFDPSIGPANGYAAPDGLAFDHVEQTVREVASRLHIASGTLASYDPSYDPAGRMRDTALDVLALLAECATPLAPPS